MDNVGIIKSNWAFIALSVPDNASTPLDSDVIN